MVNFWTDRSLTLVLAHWRWPQEGDLKTLAIFLKDGIICHPSKSSCSISYGYDEEVTHCPRRLRVLDHLVSVLLLKWRCLRLNSVRSVHGRCITKAQWNTGAWKLRQAWQVDLTLYVLSCIYAGRTEHLNDNEHFIFQTRLGIVHLFLVESLWKFYRETDINIKDFLIWKLPHTILRLWSPMTCHLPSGKLEKPVRQYR